jgi:multidrug efflux pump subunit AcrA (membrane-fusion protein)
MANASFLTTTSPQLPPLGFRWVATLHVWLLLAAGCVLPRQTHLVRSPVSGVVDRVMVAEGDSVNAGDALVHLRSHDLQHHLELLDADVETQFRRELLLRAQIDLLP